MPKIKVITRKEFSYLLNVKAVTLRSLITRKKIKESKPGFINVFNLTNQDWIVDHCNKNSIDIKPIFEDNGKPLIPKPKQSKQAKEVKKILKEKSEPLPKAESDYTKLRDEKLRNENNKVLIESKIRELELQKKQAKIIPIDFATELFSIYFKGNVSGLTNMMDGLIEKLVDELGGNYQTKLAYKKEIKAGINNVINGNHEKLNGEIAEKAKEYSLNTNRW